jgi:hypothetical protein
MPNARALNGELFFTEPEPVLNAAAAHLRVPIPADRITATVTGELFSTHSKNPALSFDNNDRIARRDNVERSIAAELDTAEQWVAERADAPDASLAAAALSL